MPPGFPSCTKPGGYAELSEAEQAVYCDDSSMEDDNHCLLWFETARRAMESVGRPAVKRETLVEGLERAGFVDVQSASRKLPWGPWPKDARLKRVGAMLLSNGESGMDTYTHTHTGAQAWCCGKLCAC